ncbi:Crp-like helix-turn-helix domain-containing protein [Rhizobium miluonense]|uniref:Crp-like helix-turn-helix domain-containing protein n=1 Tax=Rhizobium miluonense TaxID=411945 RepID=A0A1C3W163_9HYPH|nr:Crp-like helix-turn-helix domain-containing protein [Rhizobium miluonense]
MSIERRSAHERATYLIAYLYQRASALRLLKGSKIIPITQRHVADTLGLSVVHTNKTLKKLADRGLILWQERGCGVLDAKGLADMAGWDGLDSGKRPLHLMTIIVTGDMSFFNIGLNCISLDYYCRHFSTSFTLY